MLTPEAQRARLAEARAVSIALIEASGNLVEAAQNLLDASRELTAVSRALAARDREQFARWQAECAACRDGAHNG